MPWVSADSLPTPIDLGWLGIDNAIKRAEVTVQKFDAALTKADPVLRKRFFLTDMLSDDFIGAYDDIVEAWCDRLEKIESVVPFEAGYDNVREGVWKKLSAARKKEQIEANKRCSQQLLDKVSKLEQLIKKQKVNLKHSAQTSLDECKSAAEELKDIYNERARSLKGPAIKKTIGKKKQQIAKRNYPYAALEHQIESDPDKMYLRDYVHNFRRAFNHLEHSYMGGDTHVANQTQLLIKWGAEAVKKARRGGRKKQTFRILLGLTLAAFRETHWLGSSEASDDELQGLLELIASEWRTLVAGSDWTPNGLQVQSKAVLQNVLERLQEAQKQVATVARNVDMDIKFNYMRSSKHKGSDSMIKKPSSAPQIRGTATKNRMVMKKIGKEKTKMKK